jgi:pre-mRNA-splicing factor SYF2
MTQSQQATAAARAAPTRAAAAPAAAAARAGAAAAGGGSAAAALAARAAEGAPGGSAGGAREHAGDGGPPGGGVQAVRDGEAWQNMDARQRKLFELRLKLNESRKANQSAVVAEKRRKDAPGGGGGGDGGPPVSRKRAAEGSAAAMQERLQSHGLDASKAYLLDSMEAAAASYSKKGGRIDPSEARYEAGADAREAGLAKRAATLVHNPAEYAAAAAADPEFYRDANSLAYGTAPAVPPENVDRMVADLEARTAKRAAFSRRRKHYEDADMDSINDRNAHFNRKLERVYGEYTTEIKGNLERGTAL